MKSEPQEPQATWKRPTEKCGADGADGCGAEGVMLWTRAHGTLCQNCWMTETETQRPTGH
jgi:hypothetical protein